MKNKYYDRLKWTGLIFMPAFATLVKSVGEGVHWQYTDTAVTIINALAVFLGALLAKTSIDYHKGGKDNGTDN